MKAGLLHGLGLADLAMFHILLGLGVSVGLERWQMQTEISVYIFISVCVPNVYEYMGSPVCIDVLVYIDCVHMWAEDTCIHLDVISLEVST